MGGINIPRLIFVNKLLNLSRVNFNVSTVKQF
jgi:hypothetical protein